MPYSGARRAVLGASVLSACLAMLALTAPRLEAQDEARASAAARALFQEGVDCVDAGDWACAAERFGQAARLRPSPVILSNQGVALMHVGRLVEASEAFRAVLRDASASEALHADAERYVAEIAPRLGRLTISVEDRGRAWSSSSMARITPPSSGSRPLATRGPTRCGRDATARSSRSPASRSPRERRRPRLEGIPARPVVAEAIVAPRVSDVTDPAVDADLALATPAPTDDGDEIYEQWWLWTIVGVVVVGTAVGVGVGVATSDPGTVLPMGSLGTIDEDVDVQEFRTALLVLSAAACARRALAAPPRASRAG